MGTFLTTDFLGTVLSFTKGLFLSLAVAFSRSFLHRALKGYLFTLYKGSFCSVSVSHARNLGFTKENYWEGSQTSPSVLSSS